MAIEAGDNEGFAFKEGIHWPQIRSQSTFEPFFLSDSDLMTLFGAR
jgi:hypothetical protein